MQKLQFSCKNCYSIVENYFRHCQLLCSLYHIYKHFGSPETIILCEDPLLFLGYLDVLNRLFNFVLFKNKDFDDNNDNNYAYDVT